MIYLFIYFINNIYNIFINVILFNINILYTFIYNKRVIIIEKNL